MATGKLPSHRLLFLSYFTKLRFRSVGVPIPAHHQPFNVRFLVENFAA